MAWNVRRIGGGMGIGRAVARLTRPWAFATCAANGFQDRFQARSDQRR
jgi:hypothetical protein